MNRKQKKRLAAIIILIVLLSVASSLILYALKQNINLFFTPTQLLTTQINPAQTLRVGGYVEKHSVQFDASGQSVAFFITDRIHNIKVIYHGVLPNLFREGQGVVVTGKLAGDNSLQASEVLAKHDEKYMPWPLEKSLKKGAGYGT